MEYSAEALFRLEGLPAVERRREVLRLRRARKTPPLVRFTRAAIAAAAVLCLTVFTSEILRRGVAARSANLERLWADLRPRLGAPAAHTTSFAEWGAAIMLDRGWDAVWTTVAVALAAILLAGAASLVLAPIGAHTICASECLVDNPQPPTRLGTLAWSVTRNTARATLLVWRAAPTYVWAFFLVAILGPTPWSAVITLAIHNAGILGRLNADAVSNTPTAQPRALRALGGTRMQAALFGIAPAQRNRFVLWLFYRWETCVRDSTALGMLGIATLGYWVHDARARNHYDDMMFLVGLSAALVVLGDLVSAVVRSRLPRQ